MTTTGDQALYGPAAYGESQPIPEFLLTLVRYTPFVLLLAGLSAIAMFVVTTPDPPAPSSTAQVGLTDEVVWPFFDSARQRASTNLTSEAFSQQLTSRLNQPETFTIEVEAPESQAYLNILVTAETPVGAAVTANEAAALLLDLDTARLAQATEAELNTARQTLSSSVQRAEQLQEQLDLLIPDEARALAASADAPTVSSLREQVLVLQIERSNLSQSLNEELRRQIEFRVAVDRAEAQLETVVPELEILSPAEPPDVASERSLVPVAAAAAAALVLGMAAAILWDRIRGPLSSQWHAEQVAGVPVLADVSARRNRERAAGLFLTALMDGAEVHGNIIAVTGLPGVDIDEWLASIVQQLEYIGVDVVALSEATNGPVRHGVGDVLAWDEVDRAPNRAAVLAGASTISLPSSLTLFDAAFMRSALRDIAQHKQIVLVGGGHIGERESDQALALSDAAFLLARKHVARVNQLRQAARTIEARRTAFLGAVLTGRNAPGPVMPATTPQPYVPSQSSQLV